MKGRPLVIPRVARGVAWFSCEDLCTNPLGAADYLAIAERFGAVIVEGIPRLLPQQRNEARRFNILIDTLYEARTLLIASAKCRRKKSMPPATAPSSSGARSRA